jgi:hypothetical protein
MVGTIRAMTMFKREWGTIKLKGIILWIRIFGIYDVGITVTEAAVVSGQRDRSWVNKIEILTGLAKRWCGQSLGLVVWSVVYGVWNGKIFYIIRVKIRKSILVLRWGVWRGLKTSVTRIGLPGSLLKRSIKRRVRHGWIEWSGEVIWWRHRWRQRTEVVVVVVNDRESLHFTFWSKVVVVIPQGL